MSRATAPVCLCPLEGFIDIIGKKWSLLVVNEIGNHGRIRFKELMQELDGVSPRTLSQTLKELHSTNAIGRKSFNEIPPRVEYFLTRTGKDLRNAIVPLLQWAIRQGGKTNQCACCTNPTLLQIRSKSVRSAPHVRSRVKSTK